MELHMVFFKEEYGTVSEAVKHHDGLTVLAFFYEVSVRYRDQRVPSQNGGKLKASTDLVDVCNANVYLMI